MGIRRRRRKLTTLMSRLDQRVKSVELRPISLLSQAQIEAAVATGTTPASGPTSVLAGDAPVFMKIQDAYIYPKKVTGSEDRVEIYLEEDLGLAVGDTIHVSGIHGTSSHDIDVTSESFEVKHLDTPPWDNRTLPGGVTKHDPTNDQLTGVVISNTYSFKPETAAPTTWNTYYRLQTKRLVDTYAITGTTVTLTMNAAHKFQAGDIVYVDIFAEDSRAYGIDGLFTIDSVTDTTIVYTLSAGVDTPVSATSPTADVYVFPTAKKFLAVGSTWANSSNDKIYYWDGIRWVDYSTVANPVRDGDPPAPPTSLSFSDDNVEFYGNNSTPVATFTVSWSAPTLTAAGEELTDLVGYTLKYRQSSSEPWSSIDVRGATSYKFKGSEMLKQNTLYYFSVSAYDSGLQDSTALTGTHTTASGPASTLINIRPRMLPTTSYMGTITITWGGIVENVSGIEQPLPAGVRDILIYASVVDGFTPTDDDLIATIAAAPNNKFVFADGITYGTTYYFKVKLMDAAGGSSLFSTQLTGIAESLVDANAIAGIINAAPIVPGTLVTGDNIIGLSITGQLIQGLEIHGDLIKANTLEANRIIAGSIASKFLSSDVITTSPTDTGARVRLTSAGLEAYNTSSVRTFFLNSSNGAVTIGGYATSDQLNTVSNTANTANSTATSASSTATTANSTANSANSLATTAQSNIDGVKANVYYPGTTQINGGSIRTGTIVADALEADAISSYIISAGREIKLAASISTVWPRISINKDRIAAFNSSGTPTFRLYANGDFYADDIFIDSATLSGTLTGGKLRTATSGKRVEMDGATNSLKFYNSAGTLAGNVYGDTGSMYISSAFNGFLSLGGGFQAGTGGTTGISVTSSGVIIPTMASSTSAANMRWAGSTSFLAVSSSDRRIKENITNISDGLSVVNNLIPVTFNSKVDNTDKLVSGFIAQDVDNVLPMSTYTVVEENNIVPEYDGVNPDEYAESPLLSLNHIELLPYLTKAIQELTAKVDELQARIDAAGI